MLLECVNVSGVLSIEDLKIKLKDYISHNNSTDWVQGFGWDQEAFSEKRFIIFPFSFLFSFLIIL